MCVTCVLVSTIESVRVAVLSGPRAHPHTNHRIPTHARHRQAQGHGPAHIASYTVHTTPRQHILVVHHQAKTEVERPSAIAHRTPDNIHAAACTYHTDVLGAHLSSYRVPPCPNRSHSSGVCRPAACACVSPSHPSLNHYLPAQCPRRRSPHMCPPANTAIAALIGDHLTYHLARRSTNPRDRARRTWWKVGIAPRIKGLIGASAGAATTEGELPRRQDRRPAGRQRV